MLTDADALLRCTVPGLLRQRAAEAPNRMAISAHSAGGGRDRLTYRQLVERMAAMGRAFARLRVAPGDRVAVFLGNECGRECFLTALGALEIGAAVVPLNTRYADAELSHALALTEPAFVVCRAADAARMERLRPGQPVLTVDGTGGDAWPDPVREPPGVPAGAAVEPGTLGCLLFTSGTTARAKAVMHTHRSMIGAGLCCARALGLGPEDTYQGGWPFFTSSGLNLGGMSSWVAGGSFVFEEPLDNAGRLRLIAAEQGTFYHSVPSVLQFMLNEMPNGRFDVSGLRRVGYGGSAMPPEAIRRCEELWPGVEQVQIYGLTESGPSGTAMPPDRMWEKLGSIGKAMPFCEVVVVGEDGLAVPAGEEGEITVGGPGVAAGYWRDPAATAAAFRNGRIHTGDVGRLDADGFLTFTDRKKDVINRGGLKIASVAVESVLFEHAAVREAAVVAVRHPALGEDVAACLSFHPGQEATPEELAAFCAGKLADYAIPRRWLLLPDLPKNPMGKVLKTDLRRQLDGLVA